MRPYHARLLNSLPSDIHDYLDFYFRLKPSQYLMPGEVDTPSIRLAEAGYSQADVVLALLRASERGALDAAELLTGRRITHCPPCLHPYFAPLSDPGDDDPDHRVRIKMLVGSNPHVTKTGAQYRFNILKDNMTVAQFLVRGGQRRDVREAVSMGHIRLERC